MLKQWTTREKRMLGMIVGLLVLLVSQWVSPWFTTEQQKETQIHNTLQPPPTMAAQGGKSRSYNKDGKEASKATTRVEESLLNKKESQNKGSMMVDIKGAVQHPNVYAMNEGDRVFDLIAKAGGLSTYGTTIHINLAQKITDGMALYIPTKSELESEQQESPFAQTELQDGSSKSSSKININLASAAELEMLPGIGPKRAVAIIEYRKEEGEFTQTKDLLNISGIGPSIFEELKELIEI